MGRFKVGFLVLVCLQALAWGAQSIEVVQSVPAETSLAVPGIRQAQAVWLEMIQKAKSTLDLEQFYISDEKGQALVPVLKAIQDADARGVKVRLLVDAQFFKTYPESVKDLNEGDNSEARTISFARYGGVQHAKYFIVDGRNTFVGSQNFDWRALSHIHEIGLRIDDASIASTFGSIFEKDWAMGEAVDQRKKVKRGPVYPARAVQRTQSLYVVAAPEAANPPGVPYSLKAIQDLMNAAKQSIRIQVMEYSTRSARQGGQNWKELDSVIRAAAARGVKVDLLVDVSNIKKAKKDLESLAVVSGINVRTMTIPPYSGGEIQYARLIHSKYLVADGVYAWVGTENWSEGYFLNTRDVGVTTAEPTTVRALGQVFETLWRSQYARPFH